MTLQRYIDDALSETVLSKMDTNKDRTAVDHMEYLILKNLSANRFNNDSFYSVSDTVVANVNAIEDIFNSSIDRNVLDKMDVIIDVLVAEQIRLSEDMDRLSDQDYYWVEDQLNHPIHELLYPSRRNYGRGDMGRRGSYDRRRGGYRDERRESPYRESGGYREDRYEDTRRVGHGRTQNTQESWGFGSRRSSAHTSRPVQDNKRTFSENDGYNKLAQMKARQEEALRAAKSPQEPVQSSNGGYVRDVEENVSYEPVDNPRVRERVVAERPQVDQDAIRAQEAVEAEIRNSGYKAATPTPRTVLTPPPAELQGYDHTTAHPYEEFWEDDRHWVASVKTDRKLSGVGVDTFPQLYNIYKFVSYHVMDKYGNVTQEFKPVNDDNRYINQSLLKDQDNYSKTFGRKPPRISEIVKDTSEDVAPVVETSMLELEDVIDIDQSDLESLGMIRMSENLATSAIEARTKLEDDRKSSVSLFMLMDPVEGTSKKEADLIRELYSETTLVALATRLRELEGVISRPIYEKLNRKISDAVKAEVNTAFGLNIVTMDFVKHWESILKHLRKDPVKYPSTWIDEFSRKMNQLIPTFLGVVDVIDADGSINQAFEHIITERNKDRVVPFANFFALVSLDCTLDQMSIGRQLESSAPVTVRAGGNYYGAEILHAIINRVSAETGTPATKVVLSTRCGSLVEVRKKELSSSTLVLSLYEH